MNLENLNQKSETMQTVDAEFKKIVSQNKCSEFIMSDETKKISNP